MRQGIPVTTALVGATVLHFVVNFYSSERLASWVGCYVPSLNPVFGSARVWTLLTYPIAQSGAGFGPTINMVFLGLWLWWVGGSLERAWGSVGFGKFFAALTLITSAVLLCGSFLVRETYFLAGLTLPVVGLTAAWAALNPYEDVMLYGIIRMRAWMLAVGIIILMLFVDFAIAPILGLFALVNPLLGYLWVRGIGPGAMPSVFGVRSRKGPHLKLYDVDRPGRSRPLDDLRGTSKRGIFGAFDDWRQRKRLEKLWKASGLTDDEDRKNDR